MKIEQIRNATVRIEYAGKIFLTDPWLVEKGGIGVFADTPYQCCKAEQKYVPMPMCELPKPIDAVLDGIDAYVVTHVHPDHIDMAPDGTVGRFLDKTVPVFVQNTTDAETFLHSGFTDVTVLYENSMFDTVQLIKTPGRHGTKIPCGPSCGVIFKAPGEKTLYVAGDTIWYDGVKNTVEQYQPDVIIVNACAAELKVEGRLIMDGLDIIKLHQACPRATIVVSHMDTVAHAAMTRTDMRAFLHEHQLEHAVRMPNDGEMYVF